MSRIQNIIKRAERALSEAVTQDQLNRIEAAFDKLFAKVGINIEFTRHFIDRVNDPRNNPDITVEDLVGIFGDTFKKHGKNIPKLGKDAQAVLKDIETDVNIPFVLVYNPRSQGFDMISKTIMRKRNFTTSNPVLTV